MQEEIWNTTGRNTKQHKKKTCRKKHKTMQEDFQNHAKRNAKPCKKKYKTMPEEIQNTEGAPAAGERDRAAYKSKPPPSYHDSLCTVYSHRPLSSSRSWILTETTSSSSNLSQSRSWILIRPLNNALSMVCLWRITSYIWEEHINSCWINEYPVLIKKWKPIPKLSPTVAKIHQPKIGANNNVIIKGEGKGRSFLCTNSPHYVCVTDTICWDQFFFNDTETLKKIEDN